MPFIRRVKIAQRVHHRRIDRAIGAASEEPYARAREIIRRIDLAGDGERIGLGLQQGERRHRRPVARLHAITQRSEETALGTVVRPAGNDAGAGDQRRMRDVELHRHVAAG